MEETGNNLRRPPPAGLRRGHAARRRHQELSESPRISSANSPPPTSSSASDLLAVAALRTLRAAAGLPRPVSRRAAGAPRFRADLGPSSVFEQVARRGQRRRAASPTRSTAAGPRHRHGQHYRPDLLPRLPARRGAAGAGLLLDPDTSRCCQPLSLTAMDTATRSAEPGGVLRLRASAWVRGPVLRAFSPIIAARPGSSASQPCSRAVAGRGGGDPLAWPRRRDRARRRARCAAALPLSPSRRRAAAAST